MKFLLTILLLPFASVQGRLSGGGSPRQLETCVADWGMCSSNALCCNDNYVCCASIGGSDQGQCVMPGQCDSGSFITAGGESAPSEESSPETEADPAAPDTPEDPAEPAKPEIWQGTGSGDPHFKTWSGDKFDYHGECDLVLLDHPTFDDGKGLKVHIRTTRVKYFSYMERIAVQIGTDVLEFENDAQHFWINGQPVEENHKHHKTHLSGYVIRRDAKAISIRLHEHGKAKIDLHTRKNGFPAVIVNGGTTDIFQGSLGLLGDWETGKRLARDGATELHDGHDATEYALEWQVRDHEPLLFRESRFPQFPTICTPPAKSVTHRLGSQAARKKAEQACAHWEDDKEDCIFDVLATRSADVAAEGNVMVTMA